MNASEYFDRSRWLASDTEILLARSVAFRRYWMELDRFMVRNREPSATFADASYYFLAKFEAEDAAEDITVDRNTPPACADDLDDTLNDIAAENEFARDDEFNSPSDGDDA